MLRGMWDLPGPGLEPMSPALAGGFLTTVPPGKPQCVLFLYPSLSCEGSTPRGSEIPMLGSSLDVGFFQSSSGDSDMQGMLRSSAVEESSSL